MPGTVRAVQVIMWIVVVLSVIGIALGVLGAFVISAFSSDPGIGRVVADLPPAGELWAGMLFSVAQVVWSLILTIRIPRRRASTRTGFLWLLAISACIAIVFTVIHHMTSTMAASDYVTTGFSLAVSALLAGLLLTGSAKRYFAA
jgi:hypothetical protein